jgi:hypothetical protein
VGKRQKIRSISSLAKLSDPFAGVDEVIQRLICEKTESRHVEWKSTPPFGPSVALSTKYRVVKAALAFANTDGGFVVFGIGSGGKWIGFPKVDLEQTDPAMLVELINGCVLPEVMGLNYTTVQSKKRWFALLHIPPSQSVPHVTTKDVVDPLTSGKKFCLNKGAVYCRYGAKCDLATAAQFSRIIEKRTAYIKAEMLRRIKAVEIPFFSTGAAQASGSPTVLRISPSTASGATPIHITRNRSEAAGVLMYEELDSAIFESINNVIATNNLLSPTKDFVLDERLYYRIYAERQHVTDADEQQEQFARVALTKFPAHAPMLFWLMKLQPLAIAKLMQSVPLTSKSPHVRMLCRLAMLLGDAAVKWMSEGLRKAWEGQAQPPDHYFSFKKMVANPSDDRRLAALQLSRRSTLEIPGEERTVAVKSLLARPPDAANYLSRVCMHVFQGEMRFRSLSRTLDIIAYGLDVERLGSSVCPLLPKN